MTPETDIKMSNSIICYLDDLYDLKDLEIKVEGLSRKVTDDIGQVTTPEAQESLFLLHTDEAVIPL